MNLHFPHRNKASLILNPAAAEFHVVEAKSFADLAAVFVGDRRHFWSHVYTDDPVRRQSF